MNLGQEDKNKNWDKNSVIKEIDSLENLLDQEEKTNGKNTKRYQFLLKRITQLESWLNFNYPKGSSSISKKNNNMPSKKEIISKATKTKKLPSVFSFNKPKTKKGSLSKVKKPLKTTSEHYRGLVGQIQKELSPSLVEHCRNCKINAPTIAVTRAVEIKKLVNSLQQVGLSIAKLIGNVDGNVEPNYYGAKRVNRLKVN